MATKPSQEELLALALGVLPPLPCQVEVLSEDGGGFSISLQEGTPQGGHRLLQAFGPRQQVRKDLHLLARITDRLRGRYEVEFEVVEAFFQSGSETLMHIAVSGVRHRKMRRAAPRVSVAEPALARVIFCRTLARDSELEVRLADISTTGLAFTAVRNLDPGDLLGVSTRLRGNPIEAEARVIRCDPAPYNRVRVGCEITELDDDARRIIEGVADGAESGSEAERQPDVQAARERLRGRHQGLANRIHPSDL
jgi:hypothetical protein